MLEISERSVLGVWMGKSGPLERGQLANQIHGFRILDRLEGGENNELNLWPLCTVAMNNLIT